jgi:dipeptidyl aminopeptidase/acylaminoacyl peptidase
MTEKRGLRRAAWRRVLAALAAVAWMSAPAAAAARPFQVADLLRLQTFGQAAADPTGRWLVFEKTDPYEQASGFDYSTYIQQALSRLYVVDLAHPAQALPLLPGREGPGLVMGPFSPGGARLAVFRLRDHRWEAGAVDLANRTVRWLGATPEDALTATTTQWISDHDLLVLSRADGRPPWVMRRLWEAPERLPARWAQTAAGGSPAASVYGSGAVRGDRLPPPTVQLLRIDVRDGKTTALTSGPLVDMEISPTGHHVALLENAGDLQPHPDQSLQGAYGLATERHRLVIVDLATGARTVPCPDCDLLDTLLTWSPDGRRLLVYARPAGSTWLAGRLHVYAPATGRLSPLPAAIAPEVELRPEAIRAGWMGDDPLVFGRPAGQSGARDDWFRLSPGGPVNLTAGLAAPPSDLAGVMPDSLTLVADAAVWRLDRRGWARRLSRAPVATLRAPINLLAGGRAALQPPIGREAVVAARVEGVQRLESFAPGRPAIEIPLPAEARLLAWSPKARVAVAATGRAVGVQQLVAYPAAGAPVALATANDHLADVDAPRLREIDHTGPEGQALKSWLFLPPDTGAPPPLVVRPYLGDVYAGPYPAMNFQTQLAINVETLVGQGYAVLLPSLPKPADGSDFTDGLAARLLAIVDKAAADPATAGSFDPSRLALWGLSYGAYTTAVMIAQTDRFRAAIAQSGPMDLISMFGTFQPTWRVSPEIGIRVAWAAGWTETAQGGMGGPPYAVPERYVKASPIFMADRIHTPLLMLYGDQDFVPPTQGEELFSALYRQGKDAELVTYWGEGHILGAAGTARDRYARSFAWLARYLEAPALTPGAGAARPRSPGSAPASTAPRSP